MKVRAIFSMFAATLCVMLSGTCGLSEDYHVAIEDPVASDTNPGTTERPWKTINRCFDGIRPGDNVWIHKGVYREAILLSSTPRNLSRPEAYPRAVYKVIPSGASFAQMISFMAWPGDEVFVKGSDIVTEWKHHEGAIYVRDMWPHNSHQVFVDGQRLQQIGGHFENDAYTMRGRWLGKKGSDVADLEENSFFYDITARKLYIWLKGGGDPNKHTVEAGVRAHTWDMRKLDYIRMVGLKLHHANASACLGHVPVLIDGRYNIVENVESCWNDTGGLFLRGVGHTLVNSKMNHNGVVGLGSDGRGLKIIDCETSHNNYRKINPSWSGGGVKIIPDCHDTLMEGHIAAHNFGPGIWFDGRNSNVTISRCLVHHNSTAGIFYEISTRGVIKNNIIYSNGHRGIYISNCTYSGIYNNLVYGNGMSGIVLSGVNRRDGGNYGRGENNAWPSWGNVVSGNIMMDNCHPDLCPEGWSDRAELIMPQDGLDGNRFNLSDGNLYYRSDGRRIVVFKGWGDEVFTLDDYRKATGNGMNSVIAKPLFTNIKGRDFHPIHGSPVLWRIRPEPAVRFDADGLKRPSDFVSMGPYEGKPEWAQETAGKKIVSSGEYFVLMIPPRHIQRILVEGRPVDAVYYAGRAMRNVPLGNGLSGVKVGEVPFAYPNPTSGARLHKGQQTVELAVDKSIKNLYVLMGANLDKIPEGTAVAECVVHREDGQKIVLPLVAGSNIFSSGGPWETPWPTQPATAMKTREAIRSELDKSPSALFVGEWLNKNEWYPVKKLVFRLLNDRAQVVICGVSAQ